MDWGSRVTYIGSTALKEKTVTFGIKDIDRSMHLSILGRTGSGRGDVLVSMALQDIDRGLGVLLLDATGSSSKKLLERIDPAHLERVVFVDPSDAEYPYSWNCIDDIKALPEEKRIAECVQVLADVYALSITPFLEEVARLVVQKEKTTVLTLYKLITDETFRKDFFQDEEAQKKFESLLEQEKDFKQGVEEYGKYLGRDTLVRNVIGQHQSKFSLSALKTGSIIVVDFSRLKLFPTRMTPLVRLFLQGARLSARNGVHASLFIHDCIRYVSEEMIEVLFAPRSSLAVTVADTLIQESDIDRRLFALSRSGSVMSFATHPGDKVLIERAFYPFAEADELVRLEPRECIVALTIDGVRARPFFATASALPETKHVAYQDIVVRSRQQYATMRTTVDAGLKGKKDDKGGPPNSPKGFQDAFKSIFAKQAERAQQQTSGAAPGEQSVSQGTQAAQSSSTTPPAVPAVASVHSPSQASLPRIEPVEIPEDRLRQMLHVAPIALAFMLLSLPFSAFAVGTIDQFTIITDPVTVEPGTVSPQLTVEAQDAAGNPVNGNTVCLEMTSSSASGEFSSNGTVWGDTPYRTLALTLSSNQYRRNFFYRDVSPGSVTITVFALTRPADSTCPAIAVSQNPEWQVSQILTVGALSGDSNSPDVPNTPDIQAAPGDSVSPGAGSAFDSSVNIRVDGGPDRTVIVGADSIFSAFAIGVNNEPLTNARYLWSFGNGDSREGSSVSYAFDYPGQYVVTVTAANGLYTASDRILVSASPSPIFISEVTSEYVALRNEGSREVDIGGWLLFGGGVQFQFPLNTIVLAGHEVFISNKRTRLNTMDPATVALQYPNGAVATLFEYPLFISKPASRSVTSVPPVVSTRSIDTPLSNEQGTTSPVPQTALITAPVVAVGGGSSVPPLFGWLLALFALAGVAGVGLVFLRRGGIHEYSIRELP